MFLSFFHQRTPIFYAAVSGKFDVVRYLSDNWVPDVNIKADHMVSE